MALLSAGLLAIAVASGFVSAAERMAADFKPRFPGIGQYIRYNSGYVDGHVYSSSYGHGNNGLTTGHVHSALTGETIRPPVDYRLHPTNGSAGEILSTASGPTTVQNIPTDVYRLAAQAPTNPALLPRLGYSGAGGFSGPVPTQGSPIGGHAQVPYAPGPQAPVIQTFPSVPGEVFPGAISGPAPALPTGGYVDPVPGTIPVSGTAELPGVCSAGGSFRYDPSAPACDEFGNVIYY